MTQAHHLLPKQDSDEEVDEKDSPVLVQEEQIVTNSVQPLH